jgi:hypothetical protein
MEDAFDVYTQEQEENQAVVCTDEYPIPAKPG